MRHFAPAPINDDRDHWLMVGDGQCELKHSAAAVEHEIREYGSEWWTTILLINSGHGICRDVTEDFADVTNEPEDDRAYGDRRFQDARDRLGRSV